MFFSGLHAVAKLGKEEKPAAKPASNGAPSPVEHAGTTHVELRTHFVREHSTAYPRNPLHFDTVEGGSKAGSAGSEPVPRALPVCRTFSSVRLASCDPFSTAFTASGLRGQAPVARP